MDWAIYVIIGLLSGIISGMGIGGGTILIPALSIIYGMRQQTAQNINLMFFIPTGLIALATHVRQGNIEKKPLPPIIASGFAGAAAGSLLAVWMDAGALRKCFGFFLLAMGAYEFFKKGESHERGSQVERHSRF